jgi:hypothetical protein
MGQADTRVYINTPAAVGLTLGTAGADKFNLSIRDLSFVGPATACTTGVVLNRWHDVDLDSVNFYLGASGYALDIKGCLWVRGLVRVGRSYNDWTGLAVSANGIHIQGNTDPYQSNVVDLTVHVMQNYFTTGVWVDGTNVASGSLRLTGSIENCDCPLVVYNWQSIDLQNLYINDNNKAGPSFTNCNNVRIGVVEAVNDTYNPITHLINSKNVSIDEGFFSALSIDANCRRVKIGNVSIATTNGLVDAAPDTIYTGSVNLRDGFPKLAFPASPSDRRNLLSNMYLSRWHDTAPADWTSPPTNVTWTQAGTGLGDTTKHISPYCIKSVTTGAATPGNTYTLNSNQLQEVLGRTCTFTIWGKLAAAQTFATYPGIYLEPSVPARSNSTAYTVGQGITYGGNLYVCQVAGTSDSSAPAFNTTQGNLTVDGTVTWIACMSSYASYAVTQFVAADVTSGSWKKHIASGYIPSNATGVQLRIYQPQQGGGTNSTAYWAEPCLMVGNQGPMGIVPGTGENLDYVQISYNRMYYVNPPNNSLVKRGDVIWNTGATAGGSPGWICTTAGTMGGTAVWKAMANVAP